jgi:hypothetical protein
MSGACQAPIKAGGEEGRFSRNVGLLAFKDLHRVKVQKESFLAEMQDVFAHEIGHLFGGLK